jgi:hypothetical protein
MSRDVCGICWCPYDEDGRCGCENVKVINPAPKKVMKGTCIRCGKPFRSVDDIHTCTPPRAQLLADELEQYATSGIEKEVAHAVRDLIVENQKLKNDLHHYMLAANAEAEFVDELQKENEQLAEFVVAVGGFWGHTRSKLVGEDSLAECIDGCIEQNEQLRQQNTELDVKLAGLEDRIQAIYGQLNDTEKEVDDLRLLLRQALECLERSDTLGWQANLPVIKSIKERLDGIR